MATRALGIDIGGTGIKMGLIRSDGKVIASGEIRSPTDCQPEEAADLIARAAAALIAEAGVAVPVIGVGCAGLIGTKRGIVHTSPNLPRWHETPLAALLARRLGTPVRLLNDANACAVAEARLGAGVGRSPVIALTIGTGIGGAVITNGRVVTGRNGFAGEVGHMSIQADGPPCACGNRGCLELFVGKQPIIDGYLSETTWHIGSVPYELTSGDQKRLTPQILAMAAGKGDKFAIGSFQRAGEMLGVGLCNLTNLIDVDCFIIGGGIAQAGDLLLKPARDVLGQQAIARDVFLPPVVQAELGVEAGFVGAALFAMEDSWGADREVNP
jgi:glucokinase